MGIAPRMDEKMLVLGALSGIPSLTALDAAQKYVQDEALRAEAELACVRIIQQFGRPGAERDRALAVLKTIAETTKAEHIRKQAMAILGAAK